MTPDSKNRNDEHPTSADQDNQRATVDDVQGNARDREMGRPGEPLGDRGQGHRTWAPPPGEQGISNRPSDAPAKMQGDAEDDAAEDDDDDDDDFDEDEDEDDDEEEPTSEDGGSGPP